MDSAKLGTGWLILAVFAGGWVVARAQKEVPQSDVREREVKPRPVVPPGPFIVKDEGSSSEKPIVYRTVEQMSQEDRLQAANAESSIAERANYSGLEFNQGAWSYEQVDCPAFPQHIFLRFLRNNGAGDVSMFTASIPRGGEGHVRIIPIQMRSYSLFSPAPVNAMTISVFNHIRAEENPEKTPVPDWLGVGLCYAALAGGHPQLGLVSAQPQAEKYPLSSSAALAVSEDGAADIAFSDVGEGGKPVEWRMKFARNGNLLRAAKGPAPLYKGYWYLHPPSAVGQVRQVPASTPTGTRTIPAPAVQTNPVPDTAHPPAQ